MSILIKGMEMPKNCYECPFGMSQYYALRTGFREKYYGKWCCVITDKAVTSTKRNRFCPLVELPNAEQEIIRCKDCKWFGDFGCAIRIVDDTDKPTENDYCSFAERRIDG